MSLLPCGNPASMGVNAVVTFTGVGSIPSSVASAINAAANAADSGMEVSGNAITIDKTASAGNSVSVDIPIVSASVASINIRLSVTLSGNVDSLSTDVAVDLCVVLGSTSYCGAQIPTCSGTGYTECASLSPPSDCGLCSPIGFTNLNQLLGSPPYKLLQLTDVSFGDVCAAPAGPSGPAPAGPSGPAPAGPSGPAPAGPSGPAPAGPSLPSNLGISVGLDGGSVFGLIFLFLLLNNLGVLFMLWKYDKLPRGMQTKLNECAARCTGKEATQKMVELDSAAKPTASERA
jgi:hypothetical protein